ncbi:MFS transporter [Dactylosporangium darangshiense]|uniref:MFS transporter n=1 Tax=Dactylosporangium darangshiense TaxID=579108 RepID=A0ABP8DUC1_9ACTN
MVDRVGVAGSDTGQSLLATPPRDRGADVAPPGRPRLGRLGPLLLVSHLAWALPSAAAGTLFQALFAAEHPQSKVALYATMSAVGAAAGAIGMIVGGMLSDLTRSRYGRRNPWILAGAVASAAGLAAAGFAPVFWQQVVCFAVYQAGLNAMLSALHALLPDRVTRAALGRASALGGAGYLIGSAVGGIVASAFIGAPAIGIRIVPWTMVAAAALVFVLARERSNTDQPRGRLALRTLLRSVLPPRDPDFLWAFAGRFCVILALFLVVFYQLYLFTDLIRVSTERAGELIALGTGLLGLGALAATLTAGLLSDRLGRRKPLVVAASALVGVAAVPALISPTVPSMVAFYVIAGVGYGTYLSVDQALMVEVLPNAGSEAKELGFLSLANTAPLVLGSVVAATLVATLGYRALFAVTAALAVIGGLCILKIRRVR